MNRYTLSAISVAISIIITLIVILFLAYRQETTVGRYEDTKYEVVCWISSRSISCLPKNMIIPKEYAKK